MPTPEAEAAIQRTVEATNCARGSIVMINDLTGHAKVVPTFCHAWKCPRCGPLLANKWRAKIVASRPERFITLTWDPRFSEDPDAALDRMKHAFPLLVTAIRKAGYEFEYCAVWEFTKKGFPHIHIAQRGDYVSQRVLSDKWNSLHCGRIVDIRSVKDSAFLANELTKYLLKSCNENSLRLSGRRLIQVSRNFSAKLPEKFFPEDEPTYSSFFLRLDLHSIICTLETYFKFEMVAAAGDGTVHLAPVAAPLDVDDIPEGFEDIAAAIAASSPFSAHSPPPQGQSEGQRPAFNPFKYAMAD